MKLYEEQSRLSPCEEPYMAESCVILRRSEASPPVCLERLGCPAIQAGSTALHLQNDSRFFSGSGKRSFGCWSLFTSVPISVDVFNNVSY